MSAEKKEHYKAYDLQRREEMLALETRLLPFLNKLEIRYQELVELGSQEGRQLFLQDKLDRGAYNRFKMAWDAQLTGIKDKGRGTAHEQLRRKDIPTEWIIESDLMSKLSTDLLNFFIRCSALVSDWDERLSNLRDRAVEVMEEEDLELRYNEILDEFERIKNDCKCSQCGATIPLKEIYPIATYITCSFCQTQNTFRPSSKMASLTTLVRPLAEQRCKSLYKTYEQNRYTGYSNSPTCAQGMEREYQYYERYLRAMFDEQNKILPSMREQNEKFYLRLLEAQQNRLVVIK